MIEECPAEPAVAIEDGDGEVASPAIEVWTRTRGGRGGRLPDA